MESENSEAILFQCYLHEDDYSYSSELYHSIKAKFAELPSHSYAKEYNNRPLKSLDLTRTSPEKVPRTPSPTKDVAYATLYFFPYVQRPLEQYIVRCFVLVLTLRASKFLVRAIPVGVYEKPISTSPITHQIPTTSNSHRSLRPGIIRISNIGCNPSSQPRKNFLV